MSKKTDRHYLADMTEYAQKALGLIRGKSEEQYTADEKLQFAVAYVVMVIGEAASRVSEATRKDYPSVPWARISGMRHRLVHDYGNVSRVVLWDTVVNDLKPLLTMLESLTPPEPPSA
jgi:uncharacterized protein with HEPN domain